MKPETPKKPKPLTRDELLQKVAALEETNTKLRAEAEQLRRTAGAEDQTRRAELGKLIAVPRDAFVGYGITDYGTARETPSWTQLIFCIGAVVAERNVYRDRSASTNCTIEISGGAEKISDEVAALIRSRTDGAPRGGM